MSEPMSDKAPRRDRSLVYLCWLLVVLNAIYFGKIGLDYVLSSDDRRQEAAFEEAMDYIEDNYVQEVSRKQLWNFAKRGMVEGLRDRWSGYMTPEEVERSREITDGQFVGIGVLVQDHTIIEVFDSGPAEKAGLMPADEIVQVDGRDVTEVPIDELVKLLRGKAGTTVEVGVRRQGVDVLVRAEVERAMVDIPNVDSEMRDGQIGYLKIASFDRNVTQEVRAALQDLDDQGVKALILDLSMNPGGLVDSVISVTDLFLSGGLIFKLESRDPEVTEDPQNRPEATPEVALPLDVPMVVLISSNTASAAEILAGALRAHDRAELMGTPTVGKGSVNEERMLQDGSAVYLTIAHYKLADGTVVEGNGLDPDIRFEWRMPEPPAEVRGDQQALMRWVREQQEEADAQLLQQAIDYLKTKLQPAEDTD
jgi:carboxyl-terminal processing protease